MVIGVPKETKPQEFRVGIVPAGVKTLTKHGHTILVERSAGEGSGISDDEYASMGAIIENDYKKIYDEADMVVKVKEPLKNEYKFLKPGQILYTYLHLAPSRELTLALLEKEVIGIAYETMQLPNGSLPLLVPMSEIAGRMAIQVGASYLEKEKGGRGVLLGGVPGVARGNVVILGAGTVGINAAKIAVGMGANVTVVDINLERLRYMDDIFGARITTLYSDQHTIEASVVKADLLIGAVLIAGARAPILVDRSLVARMKPGAVVVDVSVDQGGCIETIHATYHENPTYVVDGVVHYGVANMPGAVPRTSTFALTNATFPYAMKIANLGVLRALKEDRVLLSGLNVYRGNLICRPVSDALKIECVGLEVLLN
ncbi:MAG: alanine dehydrogenase [Deltaproteobacteria bacterium]